MSHNLKPTVLLAIVENATQLQDPIIHNLQSTGFDVICIESPSQRLQYPNFFSRLIVKFKQYVLQQKDAKQNLKRRLDFEAMQEVLHNLPSCDYALLIRPDVWDKRIVCAFKEKTKSGNFIAYQWDGMNRFPEIDHTLHLFDRFYAFDAQDLHYKNHTLLPASNFYFDDIAQEKLPEKWDFYYCGCHRLDRMALVQQFAHFAEKHQYRLNFLLQHNKGDLRQQYGCNNITQIKAAITLQENHHYAQQSRVLVDFVVQDHKGLSLRVFEALGFGKKLITTNTEVLKYDFYHPNNIFVLTENNFDELPDFLTLPYFEIDSKIREKYSFSNWIRYVFNIEPHQKITLPKAES